MKRVSLLLLIISLILIQGCKEHWKQQVIVADNYSSQSSKHIKPGAAVTLANSKVTLDAAGAQYAVDVDINSAYANGSMELSVSTSEGLYIVGGDTNPTMALHNGVIDCPFTVIASEPGRYYIYLNAKVQSDGKNEARALTFIVQVGKESAEVTAQKAVSDGNVEILLPMTAEEEIIY